MPDVITLGEVLIDFIGERGKSLKDCRKFERCFGGAPANFAVAVNRLGRSAALITGISKDAFGEFLLETLKENRVVTDFIVWSEKKTPLAFVSLDEKGRPEFSLYLDGTADEDLVLGIKEDAFKNAKIFHFHTLSYFRKKIRPGLIKAIEYARKHNLIVSFDPNLRRDYLKESARCELINLLKASTVFLPSEEELLWFANTNRLSEALEWLQEFVEESSHLRMAVITRGAEGCVMVTRAGEKISCPAFKVKAVDTTGAGDAFSAGVCVGMLDGMEGHELLRFASAVAALSVQRKGAITSLPTRQEVEEFLRSHS